MGTDIQTDSVPLNMGQQIERTPNDFGARSQIGWRI